MAFDFTRGPSQATQWVVLRTTDAVLVTIGAHNRPNSRRPDRSRQKSSPTCRHKTTPEQFKHTFATNLHDHKWPQSRSKLEELTSEAVGEASFAPRGPRIRCPNKAVTHHRCEFCQGETHVFTKWRIFSASNSLHVAYDLTRGTFVPSTAIRSAKSNVLQAQEVPQSGSVGPPRSGNRQLLPSTDMSFAYVKQRFVCFWHSKGFSGTSDCDFDRF